MADLERENAIKTVVASLLGEIADEYGLDTISDAARDYYLNADRKTGRFQGKQVAAKNNKLGEQLIELIRKII